MKRNILLSIALGSMMFAGCSDDFLSPKPLSIFTTDNVLVDEKALMQHLPVVLPLFAMNIMTIWLQS